MTLCTIQPERSLGTMCEALFWRRDAVDRWIALGGQQAANQFEAGPWTGHLRPAMAAFLPPLPPDVLQ